MALALISLHSQQLMEMEFEGCIKLMSRIPPDIDVEKLFATIREIRISSKRWDSLVQFDMTTASIASQAGMEYE